MQCRAKKDYVSVLILIVLFLKIKAESQAVLEESKLLDETHVGAIVCLTTILDQSHN